MSLRNCPERIFDVVDLGDGEQDFLPCIALLVKIAIGYLPPSRIVVNRDLDHVFGIASSSGHLGSVGPTDTAE